MRQTAEFNFSKPLAWAAVLSAHLLFWWVLMRATHVMMDDGPYDTLASAPLQVVWIDPPASRDELDVAPPRPSALPAATAIERPPRAAEAVDSATAVAPASPDDLETRSMSAVFIEQGRQLIGQEANEAGFEHDPLAHRVARLPGRPGERIRMHDPMSVAKVVRGIGVLFAGAAYTTDPCPQIRANIANLQTGGDGDLLQEELRRHGAYCR